MSRRVIRVGLTGMSLALTVLLAVVSVAAAMGAAGGQGESPVNDQGASSNYTSTITSVSPRTQGLSIWCWSSRIGCCCATRPARR